MIQVYSLRNHTFDKLDSWGPILQNIVYEIHSTKHTTTEATPV